VIWLIRVKHCARCRSGFSRDSLEIVTLPISRLKLLLHEGAKKPVFSGGLFIVVKQKMGHINQEFPSIQKI